MSTAAGGTTAPTAGAGDAPAEAAMVPSSRLREETAARTVAEATALAAKAELAQLENERSTWQTERAVMQRGITDPEGVAVATFLHSRLPAEGRPEIGAWLGGLKAETAPTGLAGYLRNGAAPAPVVAAPAPAATPAATPATPVAASVTTQAGVSATPAATPGAAVTSSGYDAAQIKALTAEAKRTGDYTKLRAAIGDINKSVATRRK